MSRYLFLIPALVCLWALFADLLLHFLIARAPFLLQQYIEFPDRPNSTWTGPSPHSDLSAPTVVADVFTPDALRVKVIVKNTPDDVPMHSVYTELAIESPFDGPTRRTTRIPPLIGLSLSTEEENKPRQFFLL